MTRFGIFTVLIGDRRADRVVPPSRGMARLTEFSAAAMAFLAVFAIALSSATGRLADRWASELARTATIRISAPPGQVEEQTRRVLEVLATTPGVGSARALTAEEQRALLEPWFGPDLPIAALPVPQLVEVVETGAGFDSDGLQLRLRGEAPGAILDDHTRWRRPLVQAADRLRWLGFFVMGLISLTTGAIITLAAQAAMAANEKVIRTLRLVGARDVFIARAFVRRFTVRTFLGACIGTGLGVGVMSLLPPGDADQGFLTGFGFSGTDWLLPLLVPPLAAAVAFWSTRIAALRRLKGLT
ncbi:MAG: cell division protein FtsX [Rhodobacteraceae bacterium]|nr:cell division protein FtsX [Paracoccaceae bacterium]